MSEELRILLIVAAVWFVSFVLVRFTIKIKNEGNSRGDEVDEVLLCFLQIFAPFAILLYPIVKFIFIPAFKVISNVDEKAYNLFKKLILKLSK